jgi:hypothetical protein
MKILFMCPFINNTHFMKTIITQLRKNVLNCEYTFLVLNDAFNIDNGEEDYLNLISMLSEETNCYKEIYEESLKNNLFHITVPQNIHIKNRPNHGSLRHAELCNWFIRNIDLIYPEYKLFDFLCLYDADLFLVKPTDFNVELYNVDFACPLVHTSSGIWPQPSVFFINLKTVYNFKELDFGFDGPNKDMGANISFFFNNNKNYFIKEIGRFNGFHNEAFEKESDTIKQIDGHYYDLWLNGSFVHLRWGWGGGVGLKHTRTKEKITNYLDKISKIYTKYNIEFNLPSWINRKNIHY